MLHDPSIGVLSFYKNWRCVLGLVLILGVNVVWEVLNDVPAIWDMAYHQLMGISYLQAWIEGTLFREFATLSPAYPPLYYLHEAGVYLLLPGSDFRTLIVNFPYILLTAYATYRISTYFLSPSLAGWASVLVLLFPAMAMVHREALLDGALAAWVATGAWLILRSRWFTHVGWTLLFGLVCGLGALTKWTLPMYLVIPVLFGVVASKQPLRALRNLAVAALVSFTVMAPYYLQNLEAMISRYPTTNQTGLIPWRPYPRHGEPGLNNIWGWIYYPQVLASYFLYLPLTLLFGGGLLRKAFLVSRSSFLVSGFGGTDSFGRRVPLFLWSWLLGGLGLLIFLTPKDPRFVLPVVPPLAMLLLYFWENRPRLVHLILVIALIHFLTFSLPLFGPVKIALFEMKGDRDFQSLQREWVLYANHYFHLGGPPVTESWSLAEIVAAVPEGADVAVLPTLPRFHAGALQLEAVVSERTISFVDFNEGPARNPLGTSDFILAKTGHQGISFITEDNPQAMRRLGEEGWQLVSDWELPDGETAQLWKSPPR